MTDDEVQQLVAVAASLPAGDIDKIAAAICEGIGGVRLLRNGSAGSMRHACSAVLALADYADLSEVRGVLRAVAVHRRSQSPGVDIVWTGPDVPGSISRLTSQVVADMVDQAHRDVTLISFALHNEPNLVDAVRRAVDRGVFIQVLCERDIDNPNFRGGSLPFPGISVTRLCWPASHRPPGASMHAKVVVVDAEMVLIGSANITGTALLRNIECGVLLRDQSVAGEIITTINTLVSRGELMTY